MNRLHRSSAALPAPILLWTRILTLAADHAEHSVALHLAESPLEVPAAFLGSPTFAVSRTTPSLAIATLCHRGPPTLSTLGSTTPSVMTWS